MEIALETEAAPEETVLTEAAAQAETVLTETAAQVETDAREAISRTAFRRFLLSVEWGETSEAPADKSAGLVWRIRLADSSDRGRNWQGLSIRIEENRQFEFWRAEAQNAFALFSCSEQAADFVRKRSGFTWSAALHPPFWHIPRESGRSLPAPLHSPLRDAWSG